jgi:hypothetical protein
LPTTPLLIPEIATGAAAELDVLRTSARSAVAHACAGASAIAVLVPGSTDMPLTSWSLRGFGIDVGTGAPVSLPEAIAGWLLEGRPAHVVGTQLAADRLRDYDAVLAMGDGSAARTEKAPLHFDPNAVGLDDLALHAIADGDLNVLRGLDLALHDSLGATGPRVWQALAGLIDEVDSSDLLAQADPYGVQYLVATWRARWADRA